MTTPIAPAPELQGFIPFIDISRANRLVDASAVVTAGFSRVVVKASEAGTCDQAAGEHLRRLRDAGATCAVYAFARVAADPVRSADRLVECSGDIFPPWGVCDLETAPAGMADREIADWAIAFCDRLGEHLIAPVLYTGLSFARERFDELDEERSARLAALPLWVAAYPWRYPREPTLADAERFTAPRPWSAWDAWQYSGDEGYGCPGFVGPVDRGIAPVGGIWG